MESLYGGVASPKAGWNSVYSLIDRPLELAEDAKVEKLGSYKPLGISAVFINSSYTSGSAISYRLLTYYINFCTNSSRDAKYSGHVVGYFLLASW